MNTLLRLAFVSVVFSAAVRMPAVESAVPFRTISFEAAQEAASKEAKLLFIDFYTTWCEPCKRLDAETWTDTAVGKLVGEHAVALKLDAEKEGREAAKRYRVGAYPTLLLLKSDGMEVDRIVGYRDARAFGQEFKKLIVMAQTGKSGLDHARESVAQQSRAAAPAESGDPEEAQPHFELAKKLIIAGDHEGALKELLWCWDEGKKDPDFVRTRSSAVPRELGRLARDYPPAREAMIARRDQARERAIANKGGAVVVQDLIHLNRELKSDEDTISVFDQMPEGDRRRVTISIYLFDLFLEKQRYADATLFNMPESFTMNIERAKAQMKAGKQPAPSLEFTVSATAKRVEALAGAGLTDQARELGERLLELDASAETKAALNKHAARAGKPELFTRND